MGPGGKGKGKEKEPREKKKPGRVPTSCAECRRLKLRCDRNVPCEKCVSRGCGAICPDGVLTPGKGNRLILANTEELHDRIEQLSYRNRDLENALRMLQENVSDQPHPLLRTDVLRMNFQQASSSGPNTSSSSKSPPTSRISPIAHAPDSMDVRMEDEHSAIDAFGTLAIRPRGDSTFLGKTARPEYMLHVFNKPHKTSRPALPRITKRMMEVSFPDSEIHGDSLITEVLNLLPPESDAFHLCDLYLEYGKFLYTPIPKKELDEILAVVYRATPFNTFEQHHALSLLFVVFALATLFNPTKQPCSAEAHEYYCLSRTSLNLAQPTQETTLASIQALIHTAQYLDLSDFDSNGPDSAWMLVGHAVRLGHSIGLHLNGSRWKLPDEVVQRRHDLFWQLFALDTWTSLHVGRPPIISKTHVDCPHPRGSDDIPASDVEPGSEFNSWHIHYTLLLHSIMETALGPRQPVYSAILDFDRKVRDFHVPAQWRMSSEDEPSSSPLDISMYRWLVLSAKEIALLNLHRAYLGHALQESPSDLHRHRYLPSVVAVYRSAWRLIHGLAVTWRAIPEFLARVNLAWSHGLSAATVICLLITRAPTSHLTVPALEELDNLTSLFDSAASSCRFAAELLTMVQILRRKAHEVSGPPHTARFYHHHEDTASTTGASSNTITPIELDRLNGKTYLFTEHSSSSSSSSNMPDPRSRATSVTISDTAETHNLPSFQSTTELDNNVHSTLAQDLRKFQHRSSVHWSAMSFYDHPTPSECSPMQVSVPPQLPPSRLAPPPQPPPQQHLHQHSHPRSHPHQQPPREMPPEAPRPVLQPYQPYQPQVQIPAPMPYFPPLHHTGGFGSGTGGIAFSSGFGPGSGFQSGFPVEGGGGFGGGGFGAGGSPIVLDSSWSSFVEQLGF